MENDSNPYRAPRAPLDSTLDESADLRRVLSGQKLVIYSMLVNIGSMLLPVFVGAPGFGMGVVALGLSIFGVVRLAGGLGMSLVIRILLSLLMFVPLVNLVTLLILNARASHALKDAGYKIGLLGASR